MNALKKCFFPVLLCLFISFLNGCFLFVRNVSDPVRAAIAPPAAADADDILLERILLDFNNDGLGDIAVSRTTRNETDTQKWMIYLRKDDGRYEYAGAIPFDARSLSIEPLEHGSTRAALRYRKKGKEYAAEYNITNGTVTLVRRRAITSLNDVAPANAAGVNIFRGDVESCSLSDYLRSSNCLWKRKRF